MLFQPQTLARMGPGDVGPPKKQEPKPGINKAPRIILCLHVMLVSKKKKKVKSSNKSPPQIETKFLFLYPPVCVTFHILSVIW